MSEDCGRLGSDSPVLGIVHCSSSEGSLGAGSIPSKDDPDSSNVLGSTSRSGNGGDNSGLEFVRRNKRSLHTALIASSEMTTLHLTFSPFLLAAISHKSSVYLIIVRKSANRLYIDDF